AQVRPALTASATAVGASVEARRPAALHQRAEPRRVWEGVETCPGCLVGRRQLAARGGTGRGPERRGAGGRGDPVGEAGRQPEAEGWLAVRGGTVGETTCRGAGRRGADAPTVRLEEAEEGRPARRGVRGLLMPRGSGFPCGVRRSSPL